MISIKGGREFHSEHQEKLPATQGRLQTIKKQLPQERKKAMATSRIIIIALAAALAIFLYPTSVSSCSSLTPIPEGPQVIDHLRNIYHGMDFQRQILVS